MIIYFYIFFLVKFSTAQFPNHLDLQKVGDAVINHEKYKILKPTVHQITDHFKDFILRRENRDKRLFLDDNGFRHIWTGFGNSRRNEAENKTENGNKTKAKVTFFCPFLGLLYMNAFVDP